MDQDIIEKKPSSPVETTLLALAAGFMIGAIVLMGMEISELSHEQQPTEKAANVYAKKQLAQYKKRVKNIELDDYRNVDRKDEDTEE